MGGQSPNSSTPSCVGIFNQTGGLNVVHGYGYFAVGADCWWDCAGTGIYNLSGGTLNTSEGASNWGDWSKWSLIGFAGGSGTVNVSGGGVWQISDDTTYRPLAIATGDPVNDPTGIGTFGDVEITSGGQVYAHAGVMIGDVFATTGPIAFPGAPGATGILNVAGGLLDAGGCAIYIGPGGSFTVSTGTLQNIGEIMNNVQLDISTGTLISGTPQPLTMNANGLLVLNGNNTYTGGTIINSGTVQVGNGYTPGSIGTGPIVNNSVLVLDGGIVAGSISGNGAVIQAGPGLTSLTAMTNTYTGPTIIAGGTLQVGGGATPLIHYSFVGTGSVGQNQIIAYNLSGNNGYNLRAFTGGNQLGAIPGPNSNLPGSVSLNGDLLFAGGYNPWNNNGFYGNKPLPTLNTWTDSMWVNLPSSATNNPSWTTIFSTSWACGGGATTLIYTGPDAWGPTSATGGFFSELADANGNWTSNGGNAFGTPYTINPGTWNMITETVQGTTYDLYVNGQLAGSYQLSGTSLFCQPQANLTFDYSNWFGNWGQPESLGDFNLFGQSLSASAIAALYNSEFTAFGNLPATPVQIAAGAVLDLNGTITTVASLSDLNGGPGVVTSNLPGPAGLVLTPTGGSATFSGVIQDGAGQVSLTLNGPATQILLGGNTYSGLTTISAGTLQIGNGGPTGSLGTGNVALNSGSLVFDVSGATFTVGSISGTGSLTQMGPGSSLTLAGLNSYSGPTTISAGTLVAGYGAPAPLIHYNFNGTGSIAQGQAIPDVSGNGYTMYGYHYGSTASFVAGPSSQLPGAVNLNGNFLYTGPISNGGNIIAGPALPTLNSWTDSFWVNLSNPAAISTSIWTPLISTGWGSSTGTGIRLMYAGANSWDHLNYQPGFYSEFGCADGNYAINDWGPGEAIPYTATAGSWFMVTQTISGQTYDMYINGQLLGSYQLNGDTPEFADSNADLTIGWDPWVGGAQNLQVADFNLYGTALSASRSPRSTAAACRPPVR